MEVIGVGRTYWLSTAMDRAIQPAVQSRTPQSGVSWVGVLHMKRGKGRILLSVRQRTVVGTSDRFEASSETFLLSAHSQNRPLRSTLPATGFFLVFSQEKPNRNTTMSSETFETRNKEAVNLSRGKVKIKPTEAHNT